MSERLCLQDIKYVKDQIRSFLQYSFLTFYSPLQNTFKMHEMVTYQRFTSEYYQVLQLNLA